MGLLTTPLPHPMTILRNILARRFPHIAKVASPSSAAPAGGIPSLGAREEPALLCRVLSSFLHKRPLFQPALKPDGLSLPIGGPLGDRIRGLGPDRLCLDLLLPPPRSKPARDEEEEVERALPMAEMRKVVRASQMHAARARLRATGQSCILRTEFVRICCEASGSDRGLELARSLDESGAVIVWGNVVFLRPEELAEAIENAIRPSLMPWNGAEREEIVRMEKEKAEIDRTAAAQVRRELWCGLGFLAAQTAAFMRLTFWELSWDVMEPICFYVTSVYFMAGYTFFLRTCKEPSFEGFFQSRFAARQRRLMKARGFDLRRFNQLRRTACLHSRPCQDHTSSSDCHCISARPLDFVTVDRKR